jgi:hypothetical protein
VSRRSNAEIALPTVDHSGHQCTGPQILKSKDRTAVGCCWRVPRAMMLVAALMLLLATVPHPPPPLAARRRRRRHPTAGRTCLR